MTEKTVANAVVRVILDGAEDVVGKNGLTALLRYGGLTHLIDNKPDFSMEKIFTNEEYAAITSSFYKILGLTGTKAILRHDGNATAKRVLSTGVYDSLEGFDGEEKLFKALEIYVLASGRGRVLMEGGHVVYDNPQCTVCSAIRGDSAICSIVNGIIDGLIPWAGIEGKRTVETRCMAMGDQTCRHEVLPVP